MPDYTDTQGESAEVAVENLYLDEANPRLGSHEAKSQNDILETLAREMSVDEVALSIAENGYYATERLLVIEREEGPPKTYTVVEGNRRLAAVQILLDNRKRRRTKTNDLPRLSRTRRQGLRTLPVSIFSSREQLWPYLGFKHVNGPREWDAFAKAEYVAMVHESYRVPVDEISRRIGDRFSTVRRIYFGYRLVRQAEDSGVFDRTDRFNEKRFYFSHLYTAADQKPFRDFLGIRDEQADAPDPVPEESLDHLGELLLWIYGSRSKRTEPLVKTQFPDLNLLRAAVASEDAVASIRQGVGLERASEIAKGDAAMFRDLIVEAKENLLNVGKFVTLGYQGEPHLLQTATDILKLAQDMHQRMTNFELRPDSRAASRREVTAEPTNTRSGDAEVP